MKTETVYGVGMTSLQNMIFSKWISNNGIAMNTKSENERTKIAQEWLSHLVDANEMVNNQNKF